MSRLRAFDRGTRRLYPFSCWHAGPSRERENLHLQLQKDGADDVIACERDVPFASDRKNDSLSCLGIRLFAIQTDETRIFVWDSQRFGFANHRCVWFRLSCFPGEERCTETALTRLAKSAIGQCESRAKGLKCTRRCTPQLVRSACTDAAVQSQPLPLLLPIVRGRASNER